MILTHEIEVCTLTTWTVLLCLYKLTCIGQRQALNLCLNGHIFVIHHFMAHFDNNTQENSRWVTFYVYKRCSNAMTMNDISH